MDERKYLIPVNVSTRFEFISGIGVKESIYIISTFLISLLIRYIASQFGAGFMESVIIVVTPTFFVGSLFYRSADGQCLAHSLSAIRAFSKRQKRYLYGGREE